MSRRPKRSHSQKEQLTLKVHLKRPPQSELCVCEVPEDLKAYVLDYLAAQKFSLSCNLMKLTQHRDSVIN